MSARGISRRAIGIATLCAGGVLGLAAVYVLTFGNGYGASLVSKTLEGGGKTKIDRELITDTFSSPRGALVGAGPGATVSRLASLTLPSEKRAGSPTAILGLHPQRLAVHYNEVALKYANGGSSDLLTPGSSLFGLLGDLGLCGLLAYASLWVVAIAGLLRGHSQLRAAAVSGWVALVPLGVVFDWFEQPAYTLTLATITALSITEAVQLSGDHSNSVCAATPKRDEDRLPQDHQVKGQ